MRNKITYLFQIRAGIGKILIGAVFVCSAFVGTSAQATWAVLDIFRGLETTMQSIERVEQYTEEEMKNQQVNEEDHRWGDRTSLMPLPIETYKASISMDLSELPSSQIASPQEDLVTATQLVKDVFFTPSGSKDEDIARVKKARLDYVMELSKEIISYSASLRESTGKDLETLTSSSSSAGGILQEIELNTLTIKALALVTAANILLEIRIMELEAANMMLTLSEELPEGMGGKK